MSIDNIYQNYFKDINELYIDKNTGEESYYPALSNLFKKLAEYHGFSHHRIIITPSQLGLNKPDAIIKFRNLRNIGFGEVKKPEENKTLQDYLKTEQIKRYRKNFENFFLTNLFDFWFFKKDKNEKSKIIKKISLIESLDKKIHLKNEFCEEFTNFIKNFYEFDQISIINVNQFALYLANRTKLLKNALDEILEHEKKSSGRMINIYNQIKQDLKYEFDIDEFTDFFSQTLVFGYLFAWFTCFRNNEKFSFTTAYNNIPNTHDTLSRIFYFFQDPHIRKTYKEQLEWIIEDLEWVFEVTNYEAINHQITEVIHSYGNPLIYFYEDFIRVIDPDKKRQGGVYFTPIPIVCFMVRAVDFLLKSEFGKEEGLFAKGVKVLDPASGTNTFFCQCILLIHQQLGTLNRVMEFNSIVSDRILPNYFAFEILISANSIGLFNFISLLNELGAKEILKPKFFITNTLFAEEEREKQQTTIIPIEDLRESDKIKLQEKLLVVIGNPPYNPISKNKSVFINKLMKPYYEAVKYEKKKSGLDDDYIKFIRFGHWKIEQNGTGILTYITNYSYIRGLIYSGVRNELMKTFDEIYILNLHGGIKPKEPLPQGVKHNENIFGIMVGVAIGIFIKKHNNPSKCTVKYFDVWGSKEEKFKFLNNNELYTINWRTLYETLPPLKENYFIDLSYDEQVYNKAIPINCLFEKHKVAIQIGKSEKNLSLENRIFNFNKISDNMEKLFYRPFDICYLDFKSKEIHRNRGDFFEGILNSKNCNSIVLTRQSRQKIIDWKHFFVADGLVDRCYCDFDNNFVFPLKFNNSINIRNEIKEFLTKYYNQEIQFESIFHYIIGILLTSTYRTKFGDALMKNFPKILFPNNYKVFKELECYGEKIKKLHLLNVNIKRDIFIYQDIQGIPNYKIEKLEYNEVKNNLIINKNVLVKITPEEWNFHIGSRYPLQEWFERRKEANIELNTDMRDHLGKILTAIDTLIKIELNLNNFMTLHKIEYLDCYECFKSILYNLTKKILLEKYTAIKNKIRYIKREDLIKDISKNLSINPSEFINLVEEVLEKIAIKKKFDNGKFGYAPKIDNKKDIEKS